MTKKKAVILVTSFTFLLLLSSIIVLSLSLYRNKHSTLISEVRIPDSKAIVLFLSSTENSFSFAMEQAGIRSLLIEENISLEEEYYKPDFYNRTQMDSYFLERIKALNSRQKFKGVIVSGGLACQFAKNHAEEMFPGVPVVFFDSGSNSLAEELSEEKNFYGFKENIYLYKTIQVARKCFPEAKKFTAIYDTSDLSLEQWSIFWQITENMNVEVTGINTSLYSRPKLSQLLSQQPKDTVIFYLGAYIDSLKIEYSVLEQISLITQSTNLPVFGYNSFGLGHGLIGGNMTDYKTLGKKSAALLTHLINGDEVQQKLFGAEESIFCVDYKMLSKYGINRKVLPSNTMIVNMQKKFNRKTGMYFGVMGILLSILIFAVLFSIILILEIRNRKDLESSHAKMEYMVEHDYLTKLPNRIKARDIYGKLVASQKKFAVILFDVDNFKSINDIYSHACGDEVLRTISTRILSLMVDGIFFASRFGGDEFLVFYTQGHLDGESEDLEKLRKVFSLPVKFEDKMVPVNSSFGIVNSTAENVSLDSMIAYADIALYEAKNNGKNKAVFYHEGMSEKIRTSEKIKTILEDAIENDGVQVLYQPQVDLETGEIHGYEALTRLKNAPVSPADFIPVAEDTGLIVKLDRIVTEKVVQQISTWREHGIDLHQVNINYSYGQINDTKYVDFLAGLLKQYDISPSLIGIEITESLFASNKEKTLRLLNQFKDLGVSLALDDFGTGYSSLSYLTYLPVNVVKIDKSLVDNYLSGTRDKFIKNIVRLVHSLEMKLTVEGVEQQWQNEKLKSYHCDYIQGYFYSKPISGKEIEEYTRKFA